MPTAKIAARLGIIAGESSRPFINAFKQGWSWPMRLERLCDGA